MSSPARSLHAHLHAGTPATRSASGPAARLALAPPLAYAWEEQASQITVEIMTQDKRSGTLYIPRNPAARQRHDTWRPDLPCRWNVNPQTSVYAL